MELVEYFSHVILQISTFFFSFMIYFYFLFSLSKFKTRSENDLPAILKVICLTISTMFPLLGICSGCEEVNRGLKDLDIYQRCTWYRYPPKIQRAMITIIIGSHGLDPYKMYGSLTASRETCKKVNN